jgi:hypothetical protein
MPHAFSFRSFSLASLAILVATIVGRMQGEDGAAAKLSGEPRWWRGNLHTHSFWSDGDDFPEMIVAWYKEHGYHFLALSDHNVLSQGDRWIDAEKHARGAVVQALPKYRERFGRWVEEKTASRPLVRLKPLDEFRVHFEEPGRFLLIQGEEITDQFQKRPVHLNATNLREVIPPQGGGSVMEVMQNNVNALLEQRRRLGLPMLVHLNHPNYGWGVTAEELAAVRGERFFEVYNGHPGVRNYGDSAHPGTDKMWDSVLATRVSHPDGEILFGLATDDSHNYHQFGLGNVNPGRGWIMVRARHLTAESIVAAMERGDFYASTGVTLRDVGSDGQRLWLEIEPQTGVTYHTEFIGTLRPDAATAGDIDPGSARPALKHIGCVLSETTDLKPSYRFTGRELYVRARVRSSRPHPNPFAEGDLETAWTQPLLPAGVTRR